jgi:hypothetical protein
LTETGEAEDVLDQPVGAGLFPLARLVFVAVAGLVLVAVARLGTVLVSVVGSGSAPGCNRRIPDAVGAEEATVNFTSAGMHGYIGEGDERVHTTTLDSLVQRFGTPDVVLMDIQGAEAAALRGGRELLQAGRTTWLVELHGEEGSSAAAALEDAGYTLETPDPRSDVDRLLRRSGRTHVLARPASTA